MKKVSNTSIWEVPHVITITTKEGPEEETISQSINSTLHVLKFETDVRFERYGRDYFHSYTPSVYWGLLRFKDVR